MVMPLGSSSSADDAGTSGESYGAILLAGDTALPAVLDTLRSIRFTGWVAPPGQDWLVILGEPGDGVVAGGRRGVIEVAALLSEVSAKTLAIRVRRDRQLGIVAWQGAAEVGRYCSDPSQEPGADSQVLTDPIGAECAAELAALCDRESAAPELAELLDEELDTDSVFESERLVGVLRMLDLPRWLIAAGALPRDIPTGPRAAALTHLRAGATGVSAFVRNRFVGPQRRRRTPPPVIAEPPRSDMSGYESWML